MGRGLRYLWTLTAILAATTFALIPRPARAEDVLKIGAPLAATGADAREGGFAKQGYDLWAETMNAAGGIKVGDTHYKVQIIYYDDQSKPQISAELTDKLISQDRVNFLLGRGTVSVESQDITGWTPERIVRAGIAHVPQGRRLFSDLSVRQNLLLGAYARRDREKVVTDLDEMIRLFPSLAERFAVPVSQLSGGEQQMLALARGLMARPRLLLIDEPSLGLAPLLVRELMEVVDRLRAEGVSMLLVEQDVAVALGHEDRGYVLETGHIVMADTAWALLANPAVQKAYLGIGAHG